MVNLFSFYCIVSAVCYLFFGVFCLAKNRTYRLNQLWSLSSLMIAIWSFGLGMMVSSGSLQNAHMWLVVHYIGAILIPPTFLHYTFELTEASAKTKKHLLFWYPLFLIFLCLNFFKQDLIVQVSNQKPFFRYYTDVAPLYYVYTVAFFLCVAEAFIIQLRALLQKDVGQMRKLQLIYMLAATAFGFVGGATAFFPVFGWSIFPWGMYLVILYPLLMTYAIVRHRLLDIQIAVTRTGIFVFIYFFVVGIPTFLIFQMRGLLERQLGDNWWLLPAGLFSLLSFSGPFIYLIIQRKAEAVLLREQKAYQQTLLQASRGMTLIKDLDHLLKLIVHILTKTIRITHARIFLWDNNAKNYVCRAIRGDHQKGLGEVIPENAELIRQLHEGKEPLILEEIRSHNSVSNDIVKEMEALNAALVVPSFVQERLIGFVVLGNKKSNRLYTESDLDILTTLANQAALAIENCIFLTEFEHQQAHFFQAAKMADLGTMASGIGHQVNNRFNVIKLGAESALMIELRKLMKCAEANDPETIKKVASALTDTCQKIAKSAEHGGEIVRRLLDFSRLAEGFVLMDVREAIESSVRLWECKHDLREIDFHTKIEPHLVKIKGNFSEIEEVLFNMLDNAADAIKMKEEAFQLGNLPKASDWQKGSIWLKAGNSELNGKPHVLITVSEDGIGMDEETQKKVFVPFFTTKATAIKGTGLGLYIIRRMVDAHQGRIKIESEYGKGTTFYIYLPAASGG